MGRRRASVTFKRYSSRNNFTKSLSHLNWVQNISSNYEVVQKRYQSTEIQRTVWRTALNTGEWKETQRELSVSWFSAVLSATPAKVQSGINGRFYTGEALFVCDELCQAMLVRLIRRLVVSLVQSLAQDGSCVHQPAVHLERRANRDSSTGRIIRLVPIYILDELQNA